MDVRVPLLHEDFHLVLQTEASLLGNTVKLGPQGVTHPTLGVDDVTVGAAVDIDKKGWGDWSPRDRPVRLASPGPKVLSAVIPCIHPGSLPPPGASFSILRMQEGQTYPTISGWWVRPYYMSPHETFGYLGPANVKDGEMEMEYGAGRFRLKLLSHQVSAVWPPMSQFTWPSFSLFLCRMG